MQTLALLILLLFPVISADSKPTPITVTGPADPAAAPFDALITDLMRKYEIPGAALAVSREGKLLLSRGFGYADIDAKRPVQPDSRFRIASVSKPLTAVAVLSLVEHGKVRLEDHAFDWVKFGSPADQRVKEITVRQLLEHSAGWDRDASFDPMFHFGLAGADQIIREMLSRRLDFTPGARHAYSNFGYCVLGRVIERVTGQSYEEFVCQELLKPIGIESMRIGGRRGDGEREVHYYGGGYNLLPDVMDAHGGWVATAVDLVRFADAVQGRTDKRLLRPETLSLMTARPAPPLWVGTRHWYGLGWSVVPAARGVNIWHTGAMPGTSALLVSTNHGFSWAALFNKMPPVRGPFVLELDRGLWEASRAAWPPAS